MHRWARGLFGAALIFLALYGVKKVCKLPPAPLPPKPIVIPKPPIGNVYEMRVIEITNAERVKRGLQPLKPRADMMNFARGWSRNQDATRMHHSRGTGWGENVAKGYRSAEAAMQAWMNSRGHRANILNPRYKFIGVGQVNQSWTQVFDD
jgi:uncharacterized protein YkwD